MSPTTPGTYRRSRRLASRSFNRRQAGRVGAENGAVILVSGRYGMVGPEPVRSAIRPRGARQRALGRQPHARSSGMCLALIVAALWTPNCDPRQRRDPARGRAPNLDLSLDPDRRPGRRRSGAAHARLALRAPVSDIDGRAAGAGRVRRVSSAPRLTAPVSARSARPAARCRLLTPIALDESLGKPPQDVRRSPRLISTASRRAVRINAFSLPSAGTVLALATGVCAPAPQLWLPGAGPRRAVSRASGGPSHGVPSDARPSMSRAVRAVLHAPGRATGFSALAEGDRPRGGALLGPRGFPGAPLLDRRGPRHPAKLASLRGALTPTPFRSRNFS